MSESLKHFNEIEWAFLPYVFHKKEVARIFLITLLIRWHLIIEDFPWIWKTTLAKAFSKLIWYDFARIQWTSDSLPQDLIWWEVYDFATKTFVIRKWPIFKEIVLIDEINRMHPKTQSAFLQCMEEKNVTLAGVEYSLPDNHMIIATQNPIEYSGTFPLPEAQKDRFACVVSVGYPDDAIQKDIILNSKYENISETVSNIKSMTDHNMVKDAQDWLSKIHIKDALVDKLLSFVSWSRNEELFHFWISPRGLNIFIQAMKANAYLEGRDFVIPEDGRHLVTPFLFHRILVRDDYSSKQKICELLENKYWEFLWS